MMGQTLKNKDISCVKHLDMRKGDILKIDLTFFTKKSNALNITHRTAKILKTFQPLTFTDKSQYSLITSLKALYRAQDLNPLDSSKHKATP